MVVELGILGRFIRVLHPMQQEHNYPGVYFLCEVRVRVPAQGSTILVSIPLLLPRNERRSTWRKVKDMPIAARLRERRRCSPTRFNVTIGGTFKSP